MVTVGYEHAIRRRVPVDSPYSWDSQRPVPPHADPDEGGESA
jgi:hypothetical protein